MRNVKSPEEFKKKIREWTPKQLSVPIMQNVHTKHWFSLNILARLVKYL